eukprot:14032361-Alexandrium_andersonii.AAC.1
MVTQLVLVDAAVGTREHAAPAQDEVNVPEGAGGLSPRTTAARSGVRSREDPHQSGIGADRRHRGGDLLFTAQ